MKQGRVCFVVLQPSISAQISVVRSVAGPPAPRGVPWDGPGSYKVGLPRVMGGYVGGETRVLN